MNDPVLSMDVRHPTPGVAVIDIKGEVTAACETTMMSAYEQASTNGTQLLILNFDDLDYMNSGGIGMLVTLLVRANRQHQKLAAFGLSDHYKQIFELTRLNEAIAIHETESSALAAA
ncbi:MAG: STAS domain-containing protein [Actinomycetes bacterium]